MKNYFNLLTIIVFSTFASCKSVDKNFENSKSNFHTEVLLADSIIFPSILNEQNVSFHFVDFGCFHYHTEIIKVSKNKGKYQVSIINNDEKKGTKPIEKIYEIGDSIFLNCLANFKIDCKQKTKENMTKSDSLSKTFSTNGRFLKINDGLHSLSISLKSTETFFNPFLTLKTNIKQFGTLKSNNGG